MLIDLWWVSHHTLTTRTPQSLRKTERRVDRGLWVDGGRLIASSPPTSQGITGVERNAFRSWALRREWSDVSLIALPLPVSINIRWWNETSCVKTPFPLLWAEKSGGTQVDETQPPAGWESTSCALLRAFKCLSQKGSTEKAVLASLWPFPPTDWKILPASSSFFPMYFSLWTSFCLWLFTLFGTIHKGQI